MPDPRQNNPATVPHEAPPMWQVSLISFFLVLVFAGPSFFFARMEAVHPAGLWMPTAGMFLLLLALAGLPELRRTVGTRIMKRAVIYVIIVRVLSLCIVIGFGIDVMFGAISLGLTEALCGPNSLPMLDRFDDFIPTTPMPAVPAFLPTFIATCIQGAFLFVEFLIILLLCYPIARNQINKKSTITSNCQSCGYDLRMTPKRCPECGTNSTDAQRKFISNLHDATTTA